MGIEVYSKTSYLNGEMTDSEWQLLNTLHGQLMTSAPKSQVTIILEIPVKILMKRIKERARDHEQSYSETYVKALNERLIEYRQSLIKLTHTDSLMQFNYQKDQISTLGHQHKMLETFVLEVIRGGADAD
jgi:deoxyadenosine/deoxycytidine kinase